MTLFLSVKILRVRPWLNKPQTTRSYFIPLLLLWLLSALHTSFADDPDTFSPVVSYQYLDSLDESGTQTTISSPVVSYQYFDWPGDENVTFTNTPNVSYYFNGAPRIFTQPVSQILKVGGTTTFSVTADGTQPLTYQWRINGVNLSGVTGASISLPNVQPNDSGVYSVVVQNAYGSVASNDAKLVAYLPPPTPQPTPPTLTGATQTPSNAQLNKPRVPSNTQLKIMTSGTTVDPNKMTIVLTHGWNSNYHSPNWPTSMAAVLQSNYASKANILAWDWESDANINPLDPAPSAARTYAQGAALGSALMDTLGPTYSNSIHFIGHSLGTIVNCKAADYIHGDWRPVGDTRSTSIRYNSHNTHLTLLDEAELVTAVQGLDLLVDIPLAAVDKTEVVDGAQQISDLLHGWKKVIPNHYYWLDNYSSEVGLPHPECANVLLWRRFALPLVNDIPGWGPGLHGYSYDWYEDTISTPYSAPFGGNNFPMGFFWSFERNTLSSAPGSNTYFVQSVDPTVSPLAVTLVDNSLLGYADSLILYPAARVFQGLSAVGQTVQAIESNVIQYSGSMAAGFVESLTIPTGTPVQSNIAGSTPAYFTTAVQSASSAQADRTLQFSLQSGAAQPQNIQSSIRAMALTSSGTGAASNAVYTIIPIHVPLEAVGISFEYQISGAAVEDFMTMGIGNANNYTMEAKYVDDGVWNGTPVIQVADYRNQDVQLVFALNGSNSLPAGKLSIRNIQFYIPPRPKLDITVSGKALTVSWPLSAIDWTLESSTDLKDPNGWQPTTSAPVDTDYFHTMTFDVTKTKKAFFKLTK